MTHAMIEMFGGIVSENARKPGVSLDDVAVEGLEHLDQIIGIDDIDTITTGMSDRDGQPVVDALENAVDALDADIEIKVVNGPIDEVMKERHTEYEEAIPIAMSHRFNPGDTVAKYDIDLLDIVVRFGDAGEVGNSMLEHANWSHITALDINLDSLIDRDIAYAIDEDEE